MKNIFDFIRRHFTLLSFLLLQIAAIYMLTQASASHQTFFSSKMNDATSKINERYFNMRGYFFLRETNEKLVQENLRLLNLLGSNIAAPDSSIRIVTDSVYKDSLNKFRKYNWLPAKVIGNTVSLQANFLTLERGRYKA